jgi:hypothetical protein
MKKIVLFIIVVTAFAGAALESQAAIEVYRKGDVSLDLGIAGQLWAQSVQDAAPSGEDWSKDFAVKQLRLNAKGMIMDWLKFGVNNDFNDFGDVDGEKGAAQSTLSDAFLDFDFSPGFQLQAGKFRAPFSRYSLNDSYTAYPLPHAPFAADAKLASGSSGYRMIGVTGWGEVGDRLRYNIAFADGTPAGLNGENDSRDSLQYIARAEFNLAGEDKGYVHSRTWVGEKRLVTIGAGYTTKRYDRMPGAGFSDGTYAAWTVDGFAELPMTEGSAVTAEAGYYHYDKDTIVAPESKAWYVQAAYLLPGKLGLGQLQPVVKYEEIKRDDVDADTTSWAAGLNYYFKGHSAKMMLEYLSVRNQANADTFSSATGKDRDAVTLVVSFML